MAFFRSRVKLIGNLSWIDVFILLGVFMMIYLFVGVAQEWAGPYRPKVEIQLTFVSLLRYSFFSFVRVCAAYLLSLIFTFTYGYWAAKSKRAEPVLISLLDILQSVPVLAFMPGLLLALVNIFPNSNLGLEIATIIIVFTCEGWNLVFSFYTSVKSVPSELKDVSSLFHLSKWDILRKVEIPFAMNGLLWNSMLSMAGGWFYLMVAESFTLGNRDFRLPGIGSYMAVAYEKKDNAAIAMGIAVMFFLIIVVDRCLWAPLVAWSERFKYELKASQQSHSLVLEWLKRSQFLTLYYQALELVTKARDANRKKHRKASKTDILIPVILEKVWKGLRAVFIGAGIVLLIWGTKSMLHLLGVSQWTDWLIHLRDTFYTFLRVALATVLGSLWTVPLGVFIGTHPVWTRRLQPVVQVVASFPAPMVFPLITYALLSMHISLEFGAVVLMLFASQWYILFNVISGATLIPPQLIEVADVFRVKGWHYWKAIILPAIFPSLVNGWITAAGGAWNACIVSEFVPYGDHTLLATGIGASISVATQNADYAKLAGATVTMITTVVLLNRFFWGALYRLAETRFRLET